MQFENEVRKCVADRLKRGKIEVFIQLEGVAAGRVPCRLLNLQLAKAYHDAFLQMKEALGLHEPVTLSLIASQRDVLGTGESGEPGETLQEELLAAVGEAVDSLDAMRLREGVALLEDLEERRETLSTLIGRVAERAPAGSGRCRKEAEGEGGAACGGQRRG